MIKFDITVRTNYGTFAYSAIASSSVDAHRAAVDLFGVCQITVRPQ